MPPPASRDVAITGLGVVSPIGVGLPAFTAALRAGRSGVRPLPFQHPSMRSTVAATCDDFDPATILDPAELRRVPRIIPMAIAAAREALAHARLNTHDPALQQQPPDRARARDLGVILGTGGGGLEFVLHEAQRFAETGKASMWSMTNATHGNMAGEISIALAARGPSLCISTGCASSSDAAGLALEQLRGRRPGSPDAWLVIGAEAAIAPAILVGMELLKVISTRDWRTQPAAAHTASRPFDQSRDGFVLGEGAYAIVLERAEAARARSAPILGHLAGYGATCDAYHRVRPDPDVAECVRAIHLAIEDAALAPGDIDLIHYHGTGTALNDAHETAVVHAAFQAHARALVGCSVKAAMGHPQGASGLMSLAATLAGLIDPAPFAPPTINLNEPDPACDLDYTPITPRPLDPRRRYAALINCLAFGAKNAALVLTGPDPTHPPPAAPPAPLTR